MPRKRAAQAQWGDRSRNYERDQSARNLAAQLTEFARAMGRNKSDIVKESVAQFLWEARFCKTRKLLALKAKGLGIVSEEGMLNEIPS
jgi:hypothetical protein